MPARLRPCQFMQDQLNNLPVREAFASTHWSLVLCARQTNPDLARQALENLCQTYWYPLYAFARRRGESLQDAADVTQGFFAQMLENDGLSTVSPEKGRFRAFLLASFKNYLANYHRDRKAVKRGGSVTILSIDREAFERQFQLSLLETYTPETLYERCWAVALLGHVLQLLREDYDKAGRGELFAALHPYLAGGLPKSEVASQLGLPPSSIAMAMYRLRRRYAELMRREIRNTVDDPREVEDELNRLRVALARP